MRTLIIGGSGFLGSAIALSKDLGVPTITYCKKNLGIKGLFLDLRDQGRISQVIRQVNPDIIVHCGGLINTDLCERERQLAFDINVEGTRNLISCFKGKVIYFSTDCVFDGTNAPYNENSPPNPVNFYGKTKRIAEEEVLKKDGNLVIRVSGLYGLNSQNNKFLDKLRNKEKINAYQDVFSSPTYIWDVKENMGNLLTRLGIVHLSGVEKFSRYEFLRRIVEGLNLPVAVVPIAYDSQKVIVRIPKDTTLESLHPLNTSPLNETLNEMRRQQNEKNTSPQKKMQT